MIEGADDGASDKGAVVKRIRVVLLLACVILLVGLFVGVYRQHNIVGIQSPTLMPTPVLTPAMRDWAVVSCGPMHTVALQKDGTLWAWGANYHGQLGLGSTNVNNRRKTPTQVGSASDWAAVSCGDDYTVALKKDGTLWAWARNDSGELGLGNTIWRFAPTEVRGTRSWAAVSCGNSHTLALKTDGTLWAWGSNADGELGLGDTSSRDTPTEVGSASDWAAVSGGNSHTLALKTDGTLWAWGANEHGELGLGGTNNSRKTPAEVGSASDWAAVSCGDDYTMALKTDGSLWAWGYNSQGQLGFGDTKDTHAPAKVGGRGDWAAVSCGTSHTVALKTDGSLWAWGYNGFGQLGLGDTNNRLVPTEVGGSSS